MRVLRWVALCVVAAVAWFALRESGSEPPRTAPVAREAHVPAAPEPQPEGAVEPKPRTPPVAPEPQPERAVEPIPEQEDPAKSGVSLHGQVVDVATGRGVGARVAAWYAVGPEGLGEAIGTDEEGSFVLDGIRALETIVLVARAHGFHPVRDELTLASSRDDGYRLPVGRGGLLEGTVFGESGAPLADCEVLLLHPGTPVLPDSLSEIDEVHLEQFLTASTMTGKDGTYSVRGVPLHQTWVATARTRVDRDGETYREAGSPELRFEVNGAHEVCDLRFFEAAKLTLRIWTDERVQVRQAQVELWRNDTRHEPTTEDARDDGSWHWPALSPGEYTLRVFPRGAPYDEQELVLLAGESKDVEVVLATAGVVEGQVVSPDGTVPRMVTISWDGETSLHEMFEDEGRFRLTGVGSKRGTIRVQAIFILDGGPESRDAELRNVRPGRRGLRIVLPPRPIVTGRLIGVPKGVTVSREVQSPNRAEFGELELDGDGRFAIRTRIDEPFMILFKTKWRAPGRIDLESLQAGEERDVGTVQLTKGRVLEALVTNESGAPIAGAKVVSAVRWLEWGTRTNARGVAKMKYAPEGTVRVAVAAKGYPLHCFELSAPTQTLRLGPGGALDGRVTIGKENYLSVRPYLPDELFDRDLDALTQAPRMDTGGRFRIVLQPGRYRLAASGLDEERIVEIREGGTTNLDLRKQ